MAAVQVELRGETKVGRLLSITILLAFAGGYADAASYLLTGSFTGHLTGNSTLLMIHLAQGAWRPAVSNAVAIVSFVSGTGAAEFFALRAADGETSEAVQAEAAVRFLRTPLLVEGAFLLAAVFCRWRAEWFANDACVLFLCLGLGWQNGTLQKCGTLSVHTTFITGVSTSLLQKTAERFRRNDGRPREHRQNEHAASVFAGVVAAFLLGAGTSGWLNLHFGLWGFAGIAIPLLLAISLAHTVTRTTR